MNRVLARLWIAAINSTLRWPFRVRARVANVIGDLLWLVVVPRRRVTLANLRACFPGWTEDRRRQVARACFRNVARSVLDHAVLWKGSRADVEALVRVEGGEVLAHAKHQPMIIVAPHFVGLDAGGVRANTLIRGVSIYQPQSNPVWDEWLLRARRRFSDPVLLARGASELRSALRSMKDGLPFYYLPDMDHGADNSLFVPFFGVPAATLPMVSRLARVSGALVALVVTELTDDGYVMHFSAPWSDFPGASVEEDTVRMNREIERWVERLPDQYLWTHKRFKTRPPGAPSIY